MKKGIIIFFLVLSLYSQQIEFLKILEKANNSNNKLLNNLFFEINSSVSKTLKPESLENYFENYKDEIKNLFKDILAKENTNLVQNENNFQAGNNLLEEILKRLNQNNQNFNNKNQNYNNVNLNKDSKPNENKNYNISNLNQSYNKSNQNQNLNTGKSSSLSISKKVFQLLNNYRQSLSLSILNWDNKVYQLSENHSIYMENKNILSHDNFSTRIGNSFMRSNENVAMYGGSILNEDVIAEKFINMWKNSSGHDRNMREKDVNSGAVNVLINYNKRTYYSTMILVKQ